jgi:hypothetical protein
MLRVGNENIAGSLGNQIAEIVESALEGSMPIATPLALWARPAEKIPTAMHDLGFRQVFNTRDPFGPVRPIFSWSQHGHPPWRGWDRKNTAKHSTNQCQYPVMMLQTRKTRTLSSVPTRRRAFKPAFASIRRWNLGRAARIESEYERGGALQYLAAWDVRRGYVMGRCEPTTGIEPFGRLVAQVLAQEPYRSAKRLFWIVDNGSSHRGEAARNRLLKVDPRIILVHTPIHASWLNQVEIYFSIIQRKVLTPNDFPSLDAVRIRLALYENLSNQRPKPFAWKFNRDQLAALLARIAAREKLLGDLHSTHPSNAA